MNDKEQLQIRIKHIYSFQHSNDVLGVIKRTDLIITSAVDDGHRLQADALHCNLRCQQETMVEIIEKLISVYISLTQSNLTLFYKLSIIIATITVTENIFETNRLLQRNSVAIQHDNADKLTISLTISNTYL